MTSAEYAQEYDMRLSERLAIICESSAHPKGQRPVTEADEMQAVCEVSEDIDRMEAQ